VAQRGTCLADSNPCALRCLAGDPLIALDLLRQRYSTHRAVTMEGSAHCRRDSSACVRFDRDEFEFTAVVVDPGDIVHFRVRAGAWVETWASADGPHHAWPRVSWEELAALRGTPVEERTPF
jgi:hypothetical protein